jgi:hypothetical protein
MVNMQMSIVRFRRDIRRGDRKSLLPALPFTCCWWFGGLLLGMFLKFLRFFVRESERTVVEPHERLARVRHLGGSSNNRSIRFTIVIGVRNALMVIIDISNHIKH